MKLATAALVCLVTWLAACEDTRDLPAPTAPAGPGAPPAPAAPRAAPQPIAGMTPVPGDYTIKDFAFTSVEKLPEVRLHYVTLGTAKRDAAGRVTNAVVILHGTTGSGTQFFRKQFTEPLFGPGQALDLTRYYVIIPDGIGHGGSTKPSDGMHAKFPHYGYADLVESTHALLVDGLRVEHLRLMMGTSMGCMHAFLFARAIQVGLVSEVWSAGFPKQMWVVDDGEQVFELIYGGSRPGRYHGYPVRLRDPWSEEVKRVWRERRHAGA